MDWTPLIGRRPTEPEALRVLTVIHQLGERTIDTPGLARRLYGESTLLQLDHLVRNPQLLAHLLIHLYDTDDEWLDRRMAVSRRVRQLLDMGAANQASRPRGLPPSDLDFPVLARWRRLDDILALASSRGLLRVEVIEATAGRTAELGYAVTQRGAEFLEGVVFRDGHDAPRHLEICGVVREFLPRWDGPWLLEQLEEAEASAYEFRLEEQMPPEQTLLPELFLAVFHERL